MADFKVSDLNEALSVDPTDLIYLSEDNGDGTYSSKKIEAQNFDMVGGVRFYGAREDDPSTPAPNGGDRYYNTILNSDMIYDESRGKFLASNTVVLYFGRSGNTTTGTYYRTPADDLAFSANDGYYAPNEGTIVGYGYTRDDTDQITFEFMASGTEIGSSQVSGVTSGSGDLNLDFSAGAILGVRNGDNAGDNTSTNVSGWIAFKGRADSGGASSSSSSG
jgi:hypothetical protein